MVLVKLADYKLEIIVFLVGAAVLVLELTGSRVLAPYLGTSIFVWTSLIGVVLGSLSLGYWYGGRIADKNPSYLTFSGIIMAGSLATVFIALFKEPFLLNVQTNIEDLRLASVLASFVLFSPASIILGMVSPYAVRLKMKDLKKTGRTVGNLYAISTLGSIVGAFLAGFWLISYFGNTKILIIVSVVLFLTSLLANFRAVSKFKVFVGIMLVVGIAASNFIHAFSPGKNLVDADTQYNRVLIFDSTDPRSSRPIRVLLFDPLSLQSAIFLDGADLVFEYAKFYRLARHFKPEIKDGLIIGGAAYTYPRDYLKEYPDSFLDVVEIDSELTELAKEYFGLKDDLRLNIFHEDGRTFLNKVDKAYDVIFIDVFNSSFSVPYQLTTREAISSMSHSLKDDGVVLTNIISAIDGDKGKFLRALYFTYEEVFPQVYLFPVDNSKEGGEVQNIVLLALKSKVPPSFESNDYEMSQHLEHLWTGEVAADVPILTDELAPVDQYLMSLL